MKVAIAIASSLVTAQPSNSSAEQQADYVISQTMQAMGGAETLRNLKNVRLAAEWVEGGAAFRGDYRASRDGRMRIDVFVDGKRVFSEGIDRQGAWEQPGDGAAVAPVGKAAREALEHGITYRFDGLWFAQERGHVVGWSGRERVGNTNYHVLELALRDGFKTYMYVHPTTWMIERQRDIRAYHPSTDPKKISIDSVQRDFKRLCGVPFAHSSQDFDRSNGKLLTVRQVTSSRCNISEAELETDRPSAAPGGVKPAGSS